ncbi:chromate efflux transporter [Thiosulfativibrio zosterae]|uniref:chromate efflux transporter n=1 Tax=Thiosulfativibrio zosterae TaxID=2675053 RepID=UPI0015643D28|nr:chromate efflux transporter [Thiosulfativibrio zosterae]
MLEVFWQFLGLGWISFGGPTAHIAIFQRHFVEQRQWLDMDTFGRQLALAQILPGPTSSQLGFLIGLQRGGVWGAWAAFLGFTLPSFLIMFSLALTLDVLNPNVWQAVLQGLQWLIVVIVLDALWSMSKSFCQTHLTKILALLSALAMIFVPSIALQLTILVLAAVLTGLWHNPKVVGLTEVEKPTSKSPIRLNLAAWSFLALWLGLPLLALVSWPNQTASSLLELLNVFYQAGSWVFGGGHVVLPLLETLLQSQFTANQVSSQTLLLGYAAAQAVPGPMFSIAAFLGALFWNSAPWMGALLATLMIFLPGFLLALAIHPHWQTWTNQSGIKAALMGVNAAVVGLLLSAWIHPILSNVHWDSYALVGIAMAAIAVRSKKVPMWILVISFGAAGFVLYA